MLVSVVMREGFAAKAAPTKAVPPGVLRCFGVISMGRESLGGCSRPRPLLQRAALAVALDWREVTFFVRLGDLVRGCFVAVLLVYRHGAVL